MALLTIFANLGVWIITFLLVVMVISVFIKNKYKLTKYQPAVTVILAVWNEASLIRKCVDSILKVDYPKEKFSILVVGGGEDNTVEVCKQLEQEGKIKYLQENERNGKWHALNHAIKTVTTEAVAFTDGDCLVHKDWLKELARYYDDADIIVGTIESPTDRTPVAKMYANYYIISNAFMPIVAKLMKPHLFIGQNSLVKKYVFDKIHFKKSLVEDMLFSYEASNAGFKVVRVFSPITYPAIAYSFRDIYVQLLRVLGGFYSELIAEKSVFMSLLLLITLTFAASMPFFLYSFFTLNRTTLVSAGICALTWLIAYYIVGKKLNMKTVRYLPYIFPLFFIYPAIAIDTVIKIIFKRKIAWHTLKKIVD